MCTCIYIYIYIHMYAISLRKHLCFQDSWRNKDHGPALPHLLTHCRYIPSAHQSVSRLSVEVREWAMSPEKDATPGAHTKTCRITKHAYVRTCVRTYVRTCVHTYIHTYIHTDTQTDKQTDRQRHTSTYIRTYQNQLTACIPKFEQTSRCMLV